MRRWIPRERARLRLWVDRARRRWPKGAPPLLVLLVVSGVWLFWQIADEALEGDSEKFDRAILLALRTPGDLSRPIGPAWLTQSMIDLSALGGFTIVWMVGLLSLGLLALLRRWAAAAILAAGVGGISVVNALLKVFFHRPPPEVVPHLAVVSNASFPSGHATIAAATYLTIGALLAQTVKGRPARIYINAVMVALTVLVGVSRIYLGVHWPTDVIAGWALGAAWALVFQVAAHWIAQRAPQAGAGAEPAVPHAEATAAATPGRS